MVHTIEKAVTARSKKRRKLIFASRARLRASPALSGPSQRASLPVDPSTAFLPTCLLCIGRHNRAPQLLHDAAALDDLATPDNVPGLTRRALPRSSRTNFPRRKIQEESGVLLDFHVSPILPLSREEAGSR